MNINLIVAFFFIIRCQRLVGRMASNGHGHTNND